MARRRTKRAAPRRRRRTGRARRVGRRAYGVGKKMGIARTVGTLLTAWRFWKEYKWLTDFKDSQGRNPYKNPTARIAGMFGLYQRADATSPTGYKMGTLSDWVNWATTDFEPAGHTNIVQRVSPAVIGWGVSTFVGGRGVRGLPGLNMNRYMPGGWKL